jgi:hypothetical protein
VVVPTLAIEPGEAIGLVDNGQIDRATNAFLLEGKDSMETCEVDKAFGKSSH